MKVEMKVDLRMPVRQEKRNPKSPYKGPKPPSSRAGRRLWYIAVAREIEARVEDGRFASMADAARWCGVSRARICKLN